MGGEPITRDLEHRIDTQIISSFITTYNRHSIVILFNHLRCHCEPKAKQSPRKVESGVTVVDVIFSGSHRRPL